MHMYLTDYIVPSHMESLTAHRIFTSPFPSGSISPHFTIEPLPFVAYPIFFIKTIKTIEKQIHNLPSQETIPDHGLCTLTC